jgi:hypothetical protein
MAGQTGTRTRANSATAATDIPHQNLKLPAGFKAEVWSAGTPGNRAMARGERQVMSARAVLAVSMKSPTTAAGCQPRGGRQAQPACCGHAQGSLYVMSIDKVLRRH